MATVIDQERLRFPPTGSCGPDRNVTVRRHLAPFDDYGTIVELKVAVLGTAWVTGGVLYRTQPWKDHDDPTQVAVDVKFNGYGYDGAEASEYEPAQPMRQGVKPKFWDLMVTYQTPPYRMGAVTGALDGDAFQRLEATPDYETEGEAVRYVSKVPTGNTEFITPKTGTFFQGESGGRTQFSGALPVPVCSEAVRLTWWKVPYSAIPRTAIRGCRGRINATDLVVPDLPDGVGVYPARTAIFLGVDYEQAFLPDGSFAVNLHYDFKRSANLNADNASVPSLNAWPASNGAFVELYRDKVSSNGTFMQAELNDLFLPEP